MPPSPLLESNEPRPGLVSVMMPAFNAASTVGPAIDSLLSQTYPAWELVVVDDGSQDRTAEVVRGCDDPRVRLISQTNRGEAAARNLALENLRGEFAAFLDADDRFLAAHLAMTVGHLREHPEHGGVYTDGYYIDSSGQRQSALSSRRRGPFEGDIFEQVVRASDVFGPPLCVVLRRRPLLDHGLQFDPHIVIGPDWDFLTKFAEVSAFGYLGTPTCEYRLHGASISATTDTASRRLSLAACRENALARKRFGSCTTATRSYVFYDLLVNLLTESPERQEALTGRPEFSALPARERARLFRLMAGRAVGLDHEAGCAGAWFRQAVRLSPSDPKNRVLAWAYEISPVLCRLLVRARALAAS